MQPNDDGLERREDVSESFFFGTLSAYILKKTYFFTILYGFSYVYCES